MTRNYDLPDGGVLCLGDHTLNLRVHDENSARVHAAELMEGEPYRYTDFAREYGLQRNLANGWAILAAEGAWSEHLGWIFIGHGSGGYRQMSVSSWIAEYDGRHACLLLYLCNPRHQYPNATQSLLVVPRGEFRAVEPGPFDLKVPGVEVAFDYDEADEALLRLRAGQPLREAE